MLDYQSGHHTDANDGRLDQLEPDWMPDLVKMPRLYDHSGGREPFKTAYAESLYQLVQSQGRPDRAITVYRAIPLKHPQIINVGDWVTASKRYAEQSNDDCGIVELTCRVRDLRCEGNDANELGYFPETD